MSKSKTYGENNMLSFLATSLILSSAPAQTPAAMQQAPLLTPLSNALKLSNARAQLHLNATPRGIVDSFSLSVREAAVPRRGSLAFTHCSIVMPGRFPSGMANLTPGGSVSPSIIATFVITRPNKPHVATFYFRSLARQTVAISPGGGAAPVTFNISAGEQNLPYAFLPARLGEKVISFRPVTSQL